MGTHKESLRIPATGHLPDTELISTASGQTTAAWQKAGSCRAWVGICEVTAFAAGTATFSFHCASDTNGTGDALITAAQTVVLSAAGFGKIEMSDALVPAAKQYISVACTTAGGTNSVKAVLVQVDPSYSQT